MKRPSHAQAAFLTRFEEAYQGTDDDLVRDVTAAWKKHPRLAPAKATRTEDYKGRPKGPASFSKSTYHSWRRQESSPTIHDLEILSRVTGERQTLLLDPSSISDERDDDMEWLDLADELIRDMGNLTDLQRGAVLNAARAAITEQRARAARNPQEPAEALGSRHGRRK